MKKIFILIAAVLLSLFGNPWTNDDDVRDPYGSDS